MNPDIDRLYNLVSQYTRTVGRGDEEEGLYRGEGKGGGVKVWRERKGREWGEVILKLIFCDGNFA